MNISSAASLDSSSKVRATPLLALLLATIAMSFAPIFVRLCELNGSSMTFWRVTLASPFLMLSWLLFLLFPSSIPQRPLNKPTGKAYGLLILAGVAFAVDLIIWNYGVALTTVANAALFVNFAPLIVALINWQLLKKPLSRNLVLGMLLAILGGCLLTWPNLSADDSLFLGDGLSLLAAFFYGIYLIAVHEARKFFSTCSIMVLTGFVTALTALAAAFIFNHSLQVGTSQGWQALLGLALIVQVCGQGLIAYALADLSATLSAVILLMQPVFSAIIAWCLFDEQLIILQCLGMLIILFGIGIARINGTPNQKSIRFSKTNTA